MKRETPVRRLIGREEKKAVDRLFEKVFTSGNAFDRYAGQEVDTFEQEFAALYGRKYGAAVSSGTAAVHTALASLELEPGTEVACSPITDPGAVMPVVALGLIPVFADCLPGTYNMSAAGLEPVLSDRTGAIVVGHIAGEPADIENIVELASRKNIPLIEDCSQSHLASFNKKLVGTFGQLAVFSTMSGKHMTSGGQGGMILTDSKDLNIRCQRFADRGKPFGSDSPTNVSMGLNYRMTELAAVIGRVQLGKLPALVARRRQLMQILRDSLNGLKAFAIGHTPPGADPSWWFIRLFADTGRLGMAKPEIAEMLQTAGISAASTYTTLIYDQNWFKARKTLGTSGFPWDLVKKEYSYDKCCPQAEQALQDHMLLAFHEDFNPEDMECIGNTLKQIGTEHLKK